MQMEINDEERTILADVVEHEYRDLKEEVYKTETADFKDRLKAREELLVGLLRKLGRTGNVESAA